MSLAEVNSKPHTTMVVNKTITACLILATPLIISCTVTHNNFEQNHNDEVKILPT